MTDKYFSENRFGLIHGDLHFDNLIYDGNKLSLLDFERSMAAPIDYEFILLSRYSEQSWLWASSKTDMLAVESDYQNLMSMILESYPELANIPYISERLAVYSILESLNHYKNTRDKEELNKITLKINKLRGKENKLK